MIQSGTKEATESGTRAAESAEDRGQHKDPADGSALPEGQLTPRLYGHSHADIVSCIGFSVCGERPKHQGS